MNRGQSVNPLILGSRELHTDQKREDTRNDKGQQIQRSRFQIPTPPPTSLRNIGSVTTAVSCSFLNSYRTPRPFLGPKKFVIPIKHLLQCLGHSKWSEKTLEVTIFLFHHSSIFSDSPEIKKKKKNLVEKGYKLDMKSHVCGYGKWI